MDKDKSIDVLNKLIEINNDRIEGYETASKETEENDLKILFTGFITISQKCKQELVKQVLDLGGTPEEGTRITGKFFRVWMDVKADLTNKDRKAILKSCEYGEDVAVETYEKALSDPGDISSTLFTLINSQHLLINNDHNKINSMLEHMQ
jgi:uncharacterized protein (TIGR02284 family)